MDPEITEAQDPSNPATADLPDSQPEESLLDAMDRALEDESPVETDDEDDAPAPQQDDDGDGEPEGEEGEEPAEAPEKPKDDANPDKAEPKPDDKPEANKDDEAEITQLGLKDRAADRFRAMSSEIRELRPLAEALKAKGLEATDLPQVVKMAEDMHQMNGVLDQAQCNPRQFGQAMGLIQKINTGDPAQVNEAIDGLLAEVKTIANAIGREIPGLVDPLESAPDLLDAVDRGDITRKLALQTLAERQHGKIQQAKQQQTQTTAAQEQAFNAGKQSLDQLGIELQQADPAQYQAKLPYLIALAKRIRQTAKPEQWAPLIREAYEEMPYQPAQQAPVQRRSGSPVSGTRAGPGMVKAEPKDMLDSIEQALASMGPG